MRAEIDELRNQTRSLLLEPTVCFLLLLLIIAFMKTVPRFYIKSALFLVFSVYILYWLFIYCLFFSDT